MAESVRRSAARSRRRRPAQRLAQTGMPRSARARQRRSSAAGISAAGSRASPPARPSAKTRRGAGNQPTRWPASGSDTSRARPLGAVAMAPRARASGEPGSAYQQGDQVSMPAASTRPPAGVGRSAARERGPQASASACPPPPSSRAGRSSPSGSRRSSSVARRQWARRSRSARAASWRARACAAHPRSEGRARKRRGRNRPVGGGPSRLERRGVAFPGEQLRG